MKTYRTFFNSRQQTKCSDMPNYVQILFRQVYEQIFFLGDNHIIIIINNKITFCNIGLIRKSINK